MAARKRLPQSALGDILRERFACNLRRIRTQAGLTQSEVASAARLGRVFISQLERGHTSVTLDSIGAIATARGGPPAVVLSSPPPARRAPDAGGGRTTARRRG